MALYIAPSPPGLLCVALAVLEHAQAKLASNTSTCTAWLCVTSINKAF